MTRAPLYFYPGGRGGEGGGGNRLHASYQTSSRPDMGRATHIFASLSNSQTSERHSASASSSSLPDSFMSFFLKILSPPMVYRWQPCSVAEQLGSRSAKLSHPCKGWGLYMVHPCLPYNPASYFQPGTVRGAVFRAHEAASVNGRGKTFYMRSSPTSWVRKKCA
jgi:hypothetical protein